MHCGPGEMDVLCRSTLLLPDISTSTGNAVTAREIESCSSESLGRGFTGTVMDGEGSKVTEISHPSL